MSPFTQSCFLLLLLLPRSEVSDARPRPLLRRASVLHPAENAAGCHGSSAGNGEGGARLQLRLPPDQHQHPGGELRPDRSHLHHHLCGPVLPRGNRAAATRSDFLRLLRRAFTLSPPPVCGSRCWRQDPVYMDYDDRPEQTVCNGEWTYKVKHIEGCPVGVSYPVATSCRCDRCNSRDTYCGRFHGDIPGCMPF